MASTPSSGWHSNSAGRPVPSDIRRACPNRIPIGHNLDVARENYRRHAFHLGGWWQLPTDDDRRGHAAKAVNTTQRPEVGDVPGARDQPLGLHLGDHCLRSNEQSRAAYSLPYHLHHLSDTTLICPGSLARLDTGTRNHQSVAEHLVVDLHDVHVRGDRLDIGQSCDWPQPSLCDIQPGRRVKIEQRAVYPRWMDYIPPTQSDTFARRSNGNLQLRMDERFPRRLQPAR
jgi:hypothetical protein